MTVERLGLLATALGAMVGSLAMVWTVNQPTVEPPAQGVIGDEPAVLHRTVVGQLAFQVQNAAPDEGLDHRPPVTPIRAQLRQSLERLEEERERALRVYAQPGRIWEGFDACLLHPDRYNWEPYALAAGFPDWVIPELATVIQHESGGDLCAVNQSSGATCWIQQLPGGPQFFDPQTCMSWGYAKWIDGGQDFWRHWRQWW